MNKFTKALGELLLVAQQVAAIVAILLSSTNLWSLFPGPYRGWVMAAGAIDLVVIRVITAIQKAPVAGTIGALGHSNTPPQ